MDQQSAPSAVKTCDRCEQALTEQDMKQAAQDNVPYCSACRDKVSAIRFAAKKAYRGLFRIGL